MLHFVNRNPAIKVADLLDILKITKQSLGRVLKQLIDEGYIVQKEGESDRRQRLLYATPKGEALALKLAGLQTKRILRALDKLAARTRMRPPASFSIAMLEADGRDDVLRLIGHTNRSAL